MPADRRGFQAMVEALYHDGSELQTERALIVALGQDMRNGSRLATALLEAATGGNASPGLHDAVPSRLRVMSQVPIHHLGIGSAQRAKKSGRLVDLVLYEPDGPFELAVELKVGADYGDGQLLEYSSLGIPVVALVLERGAAIESEVTERAEWLGEATWHDVESTLRAFGFPEGGEDVWNTVLDDLLSPRDLESEIAAENNAKAVLERAAPLIQEEVDRVLRSTGIAANEIEIGIEVIDYREEGGFGVGIEFFAALGVGREIGVILYPWFDRQLSVVGVQADSLFPDRSASSVSNASGHGRYVAAGLANNVTIELSADELRDSTPDRAFADACRPVVAAVVAAALAL